MTDRAEIERLLQMTGRTLEWLPEEHTMAERIDAAHRPGDRCEIICHQSDVIELLIGALRDALDKQPKWISVEEELPMVGQLVLTYLGGYTGDVIELCSLDEFGGWVTDMRITEDAPITHWMSRPKPPEETNEHGRTKD